MTIAPVVEIWTRRFEQERHALKESIPSILASASDESSFEVFRGHWFDLVRAVIASPSEAARICAPLAPVLERAIANEDVARPGDLNHVELDAADLANAFECAGLPISDATLSTIRSWLPRMRLSRNDEKTGSFWSTGFAAIALDDKPTYRRYCGVPVNEPLPFTPGETHGLNLRAFLGLLAGALEHRASIDTVLPAYEELLDNYDRLLSAKSIDNRTLLWIARVVHHHIGGAPVETVAQRFHDTAWRLAGGAIDAPLLETASAAIEGRVREGRRGPRETIDAWTAARSAAGPDAFHALVEEVRRTIKARAGEGLQELAVRIARAVIVEPAEAAARLAPLASTVADLVRAEPIDLAVADLANALVCAGVALDATITTSGLAALDPRKLSQAQRLRVGFAALALGNEALAERIAGERPMYRPGNNFSHDVRATLGHWIDAGRNGSPTTSTASD